MTQRPAFFPMFDKADVKEAPFKFEWHPGFAHSQKQKNVIALHDAIKRDCPNVHPLEVSSKSTEQLGIKLSALNLCMSRDEGYCSVESVFQASKVFEDIGPFPELYTHNSREVRDYVKSKAKGKLVAFDEDGVRWSLSPTRAFYDWVYIKALLDNPDLTDELDNYNCFTDIEFNPKKSLNCQAYAVALYLSFRNNEVLYTAMKDMESFLRFHPQGNFVVGKKGTNVKIDYLQTSFDALLES